MSEVFFDSSKDHVYDDDFGPRRPAISPGKVSLTSRIAGAVPIGANDLQPATSSATPDVPVQRRAMDQEPIVPGSGMSDWDVAFRPDLCESSQGELGTAPIQRKRQGKPDEQVPLPSSGGGTKLPEDVRAQMEVSLGADFSAVRIHEGPQAESLGAVAYTQGTDIHFQPGQYDPSSERGRELLGHELTHVVQQSRTSVQSTTQAKGVAINDDAALEREADEMGAKAAMFRAGDSSAIRTFNNPRANSSAPVQAKMASETCSIDQSAGGNATAVQPEGVSQAIPASGEAEESATEQPGEPIRAAGPGRGADPGRPEPVLAPSNEASSAEHPDRKARLDVSPQPAENRPVAAQSPIGQELESAGLQSGAEATSPAVAEEPEPAAEASAIPGSLTVAADESAAEAAEAELTRAVAEARAALADAPDPAMPAAQTPGQQILLDALAESAVDGRSELTAAMVDSIDTVAGTADQQAQGITRAEEQQVAAVLASAAEASAGVDASFVAQTSTIQAAETGEKGQIAAWEGAASSRAEAEVESCATRIDEAGADQASRALEAGDAAAGQAETTLSASETNARGQGSVGAGREGAAGEGHAEVADRVSTDAADQMSAAAPQAGAQLQSHATEAASELGSHVARARAAVAAETGPLTENLSATAGAAREGVAAASRDASGALSGQGRSAGREIATAGSSATAALRAHAAGHRIEVAEASTRAVEALREQAEDTVETSRETQAEAAVQLAGAQVDEESATPIGVEIRERMAQAHGASTAAAGSAGGEVAAVLSGASAASAANLSAGAGAVSSHLGQASTEFAAHADSVAGAASGSMSAMRDAAASAGDEAVATTASTLAAAATTTASGFGQAVGALEQSLDDGSSEVDRRTSDALGDTRGRIAEGQQRVDDHVGEGEREHGAAVQRSVLSDVGDWFADQFADLWNMLKSPSFWVGLIVTLVLFPAMGPGALVVGGLAGGIVAGVEENVHAGRPWYDHRAIIRNAAIGAFAGAAMAFGLGVIAGLGLEGVAAVGAFMALAAGVGIGVNLVTGQRWDRGLLANLFLAWLFARIFKVGQRRSSKPAAGEEPVRPGEEPVRPGEEPVRPGEEPVRPGEEPVRPGEEPVPSEEPLRPDIKAQRSTILETIKEFGTRLHQLKQRIDGLDPTEPENANMRIWQRRATELAEEHGTIKEMTEMARTAEDLSGLGEMAEQLRAHIKALESEMPKTAQPQTEHTHPITGEPVPRPHLSNPKNMLPTGGKLAYESGVAGQEVVNNPQGGGGYLDSQGRVWIPDLTKLQSGRFFEWDVQLPDGGHLNVGADGNITH